MRFCKSMSSLYALMLLFMKKYSWSLIQSLKTNARTPAVSSRKKMMPRNTENYEKRQTRSTVSPAALIACSSTAPPKKVRDHTGLLHTPTADNLPFLKIH